MKAVLLLLGVTAASAYLNRDLVQLINSNNKSTWTAGVNLRFAGIPLPQIRRLLLNPNVTSRGPVSSRRPDPAFDKLSKVSAPATFDARTTWPRCPSIQNIRDQGECGSCWAVSAAETFTDRFCIESGQRQTPEFSAYYLTTCDQNDNGCEGGELSTAWEFIQNSGLPTTACQPYNISTCPPASQPCLPPFVPTPSCPGATCTASGQTWAVQTATALYAPGCGYFDCSVPKMMDDIVANGPFQVAFEVYEDFIHYKSGVYQYQSGQLLGGHAVKVIGYGTENGVDYWLVANSWTTTWGDKGYFKIRRGVNECGIESNPYAGRASAFPSE